MHFKQLNSKYIVVLEKNEEIIETLTQFCKEQKISNASFNAIGAINKITLGFYELATKTYHFKDFTGNLEVTSLIGNVILLKNAPFLHIHLTISDESSQVFGGHLKTAIVGVTLEVMMDITEGNLERKFNDEIGLNLIETGSK